MKCNRGSRLIACGIAVASAIPLVAAPSVAGATQTIVIVGTRINSSYSVMGHEWESGGGGDEPEAGAPLGGGGESYIVASSASAAPGPKSRDVRCNPGVSATTRTTTSQSGALDRYLAAQNVAGIVNVAHGGRYGIEMFIQGWLSGTNQGNMPVFPVTYADGGSESFMVVNLTPLTLNQAPMPGSLKPADGLVKSCGPG